MLRLTNRTPGCWKRVPEAVVKSVWRVPTPMVGGARQVVADGGAGVADAAQVGRVVVAQGALAGLGGGDRDAGGVHQRPQRLLGLAVVDPAARDDQRALGCPDGPHRVGQFRRVRLGTPDAPDPLGEELPRPVVRLGLHVLREGEGDGAGLGRVGQHPHRLERGGDQRLGAGDAVEVPGDRPQGVVDGDVARAGVLQLLQERVGGVGGEVVAGQQQDGQAVDGGEGRAGDEVGRAGADGRGDRLRGEPVELAGVADGGVHHGLFVAALVERHQVGVLDEGLAESGHVAVAEDAPGAGDQPAPHAVAFGVLGGQEADQGLGGGQPVGGFAHGGPHGDGAE